MNRNYTIFFHSEYFREFNINIFMSRKGQQIKRTLKMFLMFFCPHPFIRFLCFLSMKMHLISSALTAKMMTHGPIRKQFGEIILPNPN